jgi:DNA-binding MarR family transcriptional regulator
VTFLLNKNDLALLASIAENRILTPTQIAVIQQKRKQVVRRRLRSLERAGLVRSENGAFGRSRGRPEKQIALTETGADLLRSKFSDLRDTPNNRLTADKLRCVDHQVLINWFRIHLRHLEHTIPQLSVGFSSSMSPFLIGGHQFEPDIPEGTRTHGHRAQKDFAPDSVISITHQGKGKTLLFFLEVDMGTESVASIGRGPRDLRQKILNYQEFFRENRYKPYAKIWDCDLEGFRLLFLATTAARMASICTLIQSIPPGDFIWVTTMEKMSSDGLAGKIWVRGGRRNAPEESILGPEMACQAPIILPKD